MSQDLTLHIGRMVNSMKVFSCTGTPHRFDDVHHIDDDFCGPEEHSNCQECININIVHAKYVATFRR